MDRWPDESHRPALADRFDSKSFDGMDDSTHYHTQKYAGETVQFKGRLM